jgi:hypothetical protein
MATLIEDVSFAANLPVVQTTVERKCTATRWTWDQLVAVHRKGASDFVRGAMIAMQRSGSTPDMSTRSVANQCLQWTRAMIVCLMHLCTGDEQTEGH